MKNGVFANDGKIHRAAFAGTNNSHNEEHDGHYAAYACHNPAEERNNAAKGADNRKYIKNHNLVNMITQEFGIRFRKKSDNTENNAYIAKR